MYFWIALAVIVLASIFWGLYEYQMSPSYDRGENLGFALFITIFVGGMISLLVIAIGASSSSQNPDYDVVKSEKTYTVAENSTASYDNGELRFAYTENGQIKTFTDTVRPFEVGMEKPKAFKVIEFDTVNTGLAPWVLSDGTKVEVIR